MSDPDSPIPDPTSVAEASGSPPSPTPEDDSTLGGYFRTHNRPPAFEGVDGHPYTVSIEVERTPDLARPFAGYLVFPRWAKTGVGIVGHAETPILWTGTSRTAVEEEAGALELMRVKEFLDEAIARTEPEASP